MTIVCNGWSAHWLSLWRSWVMLVYFLWNLIVPARLALPSLNRLVKLLIWSILNFFHLSLFSLLNSDKRWLGGACGVNCQVFFPALTGPLCHLNWCNLYHSSGSAITLSIAVDSISLSFKWIQLDSSSQANSTNDAIPHAASPKEISSLKSGPFISWYKQDTYKLTLLFGHFDSPAILGGGGEQLFVIIPLGMSIIDLCVIRVWVLGLIVVFDLIVFFWTRWTSL